MSNNFIFLQSNYPELLAFASFAERHFAEDDYNGCLVRLRQFGELLAKEVAASIGQYRNEREDQYDLLQRLSRHGVIQGDVKTIFDSIRQSGNKAVHQGENDKRQALCQLRNAQQLAIWFYKLQSKDYHTITFPSFVEPQNNQQKLEVINQQLQNSIIEKEKAESLRHEATRLAQEKDQRCQQLEQAFKKIEEDHQKTLERLKQIQEKSQNKEKLEQTIILVKEVSQDVEYIPYSQDELLPGANLRDRYRIVETLSSGSFGQTYIAEDHDRPFAPRCVVKQFRPQTSELGTINIARNRFQKEAEALEKLNHPCIPKLQAYFQENNQFFLVQDLVEGKPLDQEIPGNKWNEEWVIDLLKKILEPLSYVHSQNIIHRDIKPSNLIKTDEGKIYLIDFGAVKEFIQIPSNVNSDTILIGTKGYMPSEQFEGHPQLSSDIYAVGVIVIQAATGMTLSQWQQGGRTQWEQQADHINSHLKAILKKMVIQDYTQRFADANEVLEALENIEKSPEHEPPKLSVDDPENRSNNNEPEVALPPSKSILPKIVVSVIGLGVVGAIGLLAYKSVPYFNKPKVTVRELTIGTLSDTQYLTKLVKHLQNELIPSNYFDYLRGKKISVVVNGDKTLSYDEAQRRMYKKEWDIAFTLSPVNSIFAKGQGYSYLAAMFPENPGGYQAGFIVNSSSPIQSLEDIKSNTLVALGAFNSASSFYIPIFDLYGKRVSVSIGHRGSEIREMVEKGMADIGSVAIGDVVDKKNPNLKIIGVSRWIPGAGVYLSPKLSQTDQDSIKQAMFSVSDEIQKEANYTNKTPEGKPVAEPDYTQFKKVIERVNSVLICSDFSKNPVDLFCPAGTTIKEITGKVNGVSSRGNDYLLKVVTEDNQVYTVSFNRNLLGELVKDSQLSSVQGKMVKVKVPQTSQSNNQNILTVTQVAQITIFQ